MSGDKRAFSDADLAATATAYDPVLFDAPAVIGHPEHNGPAWGWVESLTTKGDTLWAKLRDLDANFVEMVRAKRFKKISASFYLPDSRLIRNLAFFISGTSAFSVRLHRRSNPCRR